MNEVVLLPIGAPVVGLSGQPTCTVTGRKTVASTFGGGAFARRENIEVIEASEAATVFLDADAAELWRRCREQAAEQKTERPLLSSLHGFRDLYAARRPHYLKAWFRQDTSGKTVDEIVGALVEALRLSPSREKRGKKN